MVDHIISIRNKPLKMLALILLLTIIVFSNSLKNGFTNWDDDHLVYNNKYVLDYKEKGISEFLTIDVLLQDPITLLSQGLVMKYAGAKPFPFHLVNLIFHLLNIILVYYLIKRLTSRHVIALITTLFFAIHPFRVESVAWIAERKDVLYAFFYLLGLLCYYYYLTKEKKKYLFLTWLFASLSLFSKTAAVTFPLVLFLMDYFLGKKITFKNSLSKIPFFILPCLVGFLQINPIFFTDIKSQYSTAMILPNNFVDLYHYTYFHRFFLACYSFCWYFLQCVIPYKLCAAHVYPYMVNNILPLKYYLSPIVFFAIVILLIWLVKKFVNIRKDLVFGLLFFCFSIGLVIHIFPVGGMVVTAERYTYMAYLGLFFIVGKLFDIGFSYDWKRPEVIKPLIYGTLAVIICYYSYTSFQRNKVWENGTKLFTDVIEQYPKSAFAYNNRGNDRRDRKDYSGAIEDFNTAIHYFPFNPDPYYNRGLVWMDVSNYNAAIQDFTLAIKSSKVNIRALINRGICKHWISDFDGALEDFNEVLKLEPRNIYAHYNRARVYLSTRKNDALAVKDFTEVLNQDNRDPSTYYYRGIAQADKKLAVLDFDKAIEIYPNFIEAYYYRGNAKKDLKDFIGALTDMNKAIDLKLSEVSGGEKFTTSGKIAYKEQALDFSNLDNKSFAFYNRGRIQLLLGNFNKAINDFNVAIDINNKFVDAYVSRGNASLSVKDYYSAMNDYNYALKIKGDVVEAFFGRGNVYYVTKKYQLAIDEYNKALAIKPDATIYSNRGNAKYVLNDYAGSLLDYNQAINLEKENADYPFNRGLVKLNMNNKKSACEDFTLAEKLGNKKAKLALDKYCK